MKDLLQRCSENTGYDEETVKKITFCFLRIVTDRLSAGDTVDLGSEFGIIRRCTDSNVEKNSDISLFEINRDMDSFRESDSLKCELRTTEQAVEIAVSPIGLLETLQCRAGCMYLSDLHAPSTMPLIRGALRKIEPDSFDLKEWTDAVLYITGKKREFRTQADAAEFLSNFPYASTHLGDEDYKVH